MRMPDRRFRLLPERISTSTLQSLNVRVLFIPSEARISRSGCICRARFLRSGCICGARISHPGRFCGAERDAGTFLRFVGARHAVPALSSTGTPVRFCAPQGGQSAQCGADCAACPDLVGVTIRCDGDWAAQAKWAGWFWVALDKSEGVVKGHSFSAML